MDQSTTSNNTMANLIIPSFDHQEELEALFLRQSKQMDALNFNYSDNNSSNDGGGGSIDPTYRTSISNWAYNVIDYFHLDRSVVAYTMSYLDHFCNRYKCDTTVFRLVSLSALFLSIKVHGMNSDVFAPSDCDACRSTSKEEVAVTCLNSIMQLSRGEFKVAHVISMENLLCRTLEWRLHPVIPAEYVTLVLSETQPDEIISEESLIQHHHDQEFKKVALFCTELAVCDPYFCGVPSDRIAYAAVRVAARVCCKSHDRYCLFSQASSLLYYLRRKFDYGSDAYNSCDDIDLDVADGDAQSCRRKDIEERLCFLYKCSCDNKSDNYNVRNDKDVVRQANDDAYKSSFGDVEIEKASVQGDSSMYKRKKSSTPIRNKKLHWRRTNGDKLSDIFKTKSCNSVCETQSPVCISSSSLSSDVEHQSCRHCLSTLSYINRRETI